MVMYNMILPNGRISITHLLPFDRLLVRCMAFTDFMGFAGAKKTEIMPTEFVPSNYGVYPPPDWVFDHLYELGYQDMRAWLEKHLDERLAEIKASDAEAGAI